MSQPVLAFIQRFFFLRTLKPLSIDHLGTSSSTKFVKHGQQRCYKKRIQIPQELYGTTNLLDRAWPGLPAWHTLYTPSVYKWFKGLRGADATEARPGLSYWHFGTNIVDVTSCEKVYRYGE